MSQRTTRRIVATVPVPSPVGPDRAAQAFPILTGFRDRRTGAVAYVAVETSDPRIGESALSRYLDDHAAELPGQVAPGATWAELRRTPWECQPGYHWSGSYAPMVTDLSAIRVVEACYLDQDAYGGPINWRTGIPGPRQDIVPTSEWGNNRNVHDPEYTPVAALNRALAAGLVELAEDTGPAECVVRLTTRQWGPLDGRDYWWVRWTAREREAAVTVGV